MRFDDVVAAAARWPAVTEEFWYGTPGLKVAGKGFCRLWSEREYARNNVSDTEVLVVLCDVDEKSALIETFGGVLFSTPHYDGHGSLLVRLDEVEPVDLEGLLADSYRIKASASLVREFERQRPSTDWSQY